MQWPSLAALYKDAQFLLRYTNGKKAAQNLMGIASYHVILYSG